MVDKKVSILHSIADIFGVIVNNPAFSNLIELNLENNQPLKLKLVNSEIEVIQGNLSDEVWSKLLTTAGSPYPDPNQSLVIISNPETQKWQIDNLIKAMKTLEIVKS